MKAEKHKLKMGKEKQEKITGKDRLRSNEDDRTLGSDLFFIVSDTIPGVYLCYYLCTSLNKFPNSILLSSLSSIYMQTEKEKKILRGLVGLTNISPIP